MILSYPIEGGSFWLEVLGYDMSWSRYSRSASPSEIRGVIPNCLKASFWSDERSNGFGGAKS